MSANQDTRTNFYFYAPYEDQAKLEKLRDTYPDYDAVGTWMDKPFNKWSLVLKKEFNYSVTDINELDESFMQAAHKYGVEYDGYERPVIH